MDENNRKTILDLCAGTGAWSRPYVEAGYNVISVTLPENDVRTFIPPKNVYGILAAPPCTMFSLARTRAKAPRNLRAGMETVIACLNIIWECRHEPLYRKDNCLKFWALENPMCLLRRDFGENYTKKTDLWGYFNIPKINKIELTADEKQLCKVNNRKLPSISDITSSKQADRRAITPAGFAKSFFKANR